MIYAKNIYAVNKQWMFTNNLALSESSVKEVIGSSPNLLSAFEHIETSVAIIHLIRG